MTQFDLFPNPIPGVRRSIPYVVLLQSDFAKTGRHRMVAPLAERTRTPAIDWRLLPNAVIDGRELHILIPSMAAVAAADLRKPVGNLASERDRIIAALDYLFLGF